MYYKRKRKKSSVVAMFCLLLLFASLTYGYFTNNKEPLTKPNEAQQNEKNSVEDTEKNNVEVVKNEEESEASEASNENGNIVDSQEDHNLQLVNKNTEIIFNTYYKATGDTKIDKTKVPVTLVGSTLQEFKSYIEDYYDNWKIRNISTDVVTLFQEKDGFTPNQYIVQGKDGFIVVYKIDANGEKVLHYETDISLSVLNEIDRQKLEKGIVVKSFDDALMIIQDYNS